MHLEKLLHTSTGKIILSILLGFGLATFFRTVCVGNRCIVRYAPALSDVLDKVFRYDDKCYKYTPVPAKCGSAAALTFAK